MINLSELIHQFESWPEPVKPPFSEIKMIGCCEEHEQKSDFVWYRKYNWQELRDLILSKNRIIEDEIDPYSFCSLDPKVFRYYLKGALSALAQEVERSSSFEELPFPVWLWIEHDKKDLEKIKSLKKITTEFSKKEIEEIIKLLECVGQLDMDSLASKKPQETITDTVLYWQEIYTKI